MAADLRLHERLDLMQATHMISWLLRLDEVWTAWLRRDELDQSEKEQLADLATEMERLLFAVSSKDRLIEMQNAVTVRRDPAAATVQAIFRELPQPPEALQYLSQPEGYRRFMEDRITDLADAAPVEIDALGTKAARLRNGEWVPGDLILQL